MNNGRILIDMELINLENVMSVLEEYGNDVRNLYQDNLIRNNRIASGDLLNSVEYNVVQNGMEYEVTLTLADYWKYIEEGTLPHFPPIDKILQWVQIKPVIPRPDKNGNIPTPRSLAYLISRKIAKHGTQGTHDLQSAIDVMNAKYRDKLIIALHDDCEQIMKVVVGQIQGSISH